MMHKNIDDVQSVKTVTHHDDIKVPETSQKERPSFLDRACSYLSDHYAPISDDVKRG